MRAIGALAAVIALAALSGEARAQATTTRASLTLEGAKAVAAAAAAEAKRGNEGGSIAIVDEGGNLMYLERIQPTFAMGAHIATEKARTAALFQRPSKALEDVILGGRSSLLSVVPAPLQGGEPIVVDGQIVGAVGVSGAASAVRDQVIASAGAAALGAKTSASR
ncbi:MAG TPA: heme-binding protein [Gemmatimonadales bacterium]|jgi:glc operon protein GlcG|nr:heme-binding protein [Gemmatimonadales bacterium]